MKKQLVEVSVADFLSKVAVRAIADRLQTGDPSAIDEAVRFVCAESVNHWHGRGRAMMCRRLKHHPLSRGQVERLVEKILGRLVSGHFSEQFRDQLRLALHLDRKGTLLIARCGTRGEKPHIRRYSEWVLSREEATNESNNALHSDAGERGRCTS